MLPIFSALCLVLAPLPAQVTGKPSLPIRGPLLPVQLDAGTGTITRGPVPSSRAAASVSDFPNLDLSGFMAIDTGGGLTEWFNDGTKGAANASDLLSGFTLPYATGKLDPALGGPGATIRLGFYEGYTRADRRGTSTPDGTAVAVFTLDGLPGHSTSSSFFSGFTSYLLRVSLPDLISFADGPIGYSWRFQDQGTAGVLAGTWPFLANAGGCNGDIPIPGDPQGQDAFTCCSFAPADVYSPPGQLRVVFTFAPYCIPYSIALDLHEVADLPAGATPFNGSGVNVDVLSCSPAIVGQLWTAQVALGHGHGSSGTVEIRIHTGTFDGPTFRSPLGGRRVEPLVTGPQLARLIRPHDGVTSTPVVNPIPLRFALVGRSWAAQAIVVGGGFGDLSSCVFGVVGTE